MATKPESSGDVQRSHGHPWLWTIILIFIIYPLSFGPALKLFEHKIIPEPFIDVVYSPLDYLCKNCQPADVIFSWYIEDIWGFEYPTEP